MKVAYLALGIAAALSLSGCQTINTAMAYNQTVNYVEMEDDTYRVFDHPTEQKVMTASSIGRGIAAGAARGATLGLAQPFTEQELHERAARQHLDNTGRASCTIDRGKLLAQPQYEFWYTCP